jgi:hypothetical protein
MSRDDDEWSENSGLYHQDKLSLILIHVGETRKGIVNLEASLKDVNRQLAGSVRRADCTEKHSIVNATMADLKVDTEEIKKDMKTLARNTTKDDFVSVNRVKEVLEKEAEEAIEKRRKHILFWFAIIPTVTTLVCGGIFGMWKIFIFMSKIDSSMSATTKELREEINNTKEKVIYVYSKSKEGEDKSAVKSKSNKKEAE